MQNLPCWTRNFFQRRTAIIYELTFSTVPASRCTKSGIFLSSWSLWFYTWIRNKDFDPTKKGAYSSLFLEIMSALPEPTNTAISQEIGIIWFFFLPFLNFKHDKLGLGSSNPSSSNSSIILIFTYTGNCKNYTSSNTKLSLAHTPISLSRLASPTKLFGPIFNITLTCGALWSLQFFGGMGILPFWNARN